MENMLGLALKSVKAPTWIVSIGRKWYHGATSYSSLKGKLKNVYAMELYISRDNTLPMFATGKSPSEYISNNNICDERESSMMATWRKVFGFHHQ